MAASVRYITYEYKTLLHNAAIVLSIVMLAVIGVNSFLAFMAPSWPIRLISFAGTLFGVCSCWSRSHRKSAPFQMRSLILRKQRFPQINLYNHTSSSSIPQSFLMSIFT